MGPPLPLLLLAAAGVKQLLKRRPHRRRCAGASTAESQRDPCCAATTETSRAMSCAASVESTMVSWSPVPMLLSQLSLLLHTSLTAMGCGWTEFTPVMQAIMQCTWTLRWLLAVQAGAAEAFASDFDLVSPSRRQGAPLLASHGPFSEHMLPLPATKQANWFMPSSQSAFVEEMTAKAAQDAASRVENLQTAHLRCAWLSGSWQLTKAWDVVEKQPSAAELLQLGGVARTGMRMFKGMSTFARLGCLLMQSA